MAGLNRRIPFYTRSAFGYVKKRQTASGGAGNCARRSGVNAALRPIRANAAVVPVIPALGITLKTQQRISFSGLGPEPFRIFFPAAVLAGIIGAGLWPLHFWGILDWYPGQIHARIMAYGLFGGFILGFLGTALPRMLSAPPFRISEVIPLFLTHSAMVLSFAASKVFIGDLLLLLLLLGFFGCVAIRAAHRKDTPPPGFVLVGLAFVCVVTGAALALVEHYREVNVFWSMLQRLLAYQGFVLLPILGIGPFLLPRFFGLESPHDFPEALVPTAGWLRKALIAFAAGALIIGSFLVEAHGWYRTAYSIRFATTLVYLFLEMPFRSAPKVNNALGISIRIAFICILAGFLAVSFFPGYRVSLLHFTLIGGFAVIAFVVATRVVFGHSGNLALLKGRNRWLLIAIGLMLFGMATRISGDFWPKILASHYIYGALLWIAGVLLWAVYVLPKVLLADTED
jgi:uncharacterized protein involved in response to NO